MEGPVGGWLGGPWFGGSGRTHTFQQLDLVQSRLGVLGRALHHLQRHKTLPPVEGTQESGGVPPLPTVPLPPQGSQGWGHSPNVPAEPDGGEVPPAQLAHHVVATVEEVPDPHWVIPSWGGGAQRGEGGSLAPQCPPPLPQTQASGRPHLCSSPGGPPAPPRQSPAAPPTAGTGEGGSLVTHPRGGWGSCGVGKRARLGTQASALPTLPQSQGIQVSDTPPPIPGPIGGLPHSREGGPQGGPTGGKRVRGWEWSQENAGRSRRPPRLECVWGCEAHWDITPPKIEMTSGPQAPRG